MHPGSFHARLIILVLLLVIPAVALIFTANLKRQESEKSLATEKAVTIARLAAATESHFVRQTRLQLATMTQFPLVMLKDYALLEKGLKSLKRLQTDYDDFGLIEPDGTVFCHTLGSNVSDTVDPLLLGKVRDQKDLAAGLLRSDRLKGQPLLQFGYPVIATNGELARVMYASLKTTLLADALTNIILPPGGIVNLFDASGAILARWPGPEDWIGKDLSSSPFIQATLKLQDGSFEAKGLDGTNRFYAVSAVRHAQKPYLFVTVGIPRQDLFAQANQAFIASSLLVLAIVITSLTVAWYFSQRAFLSPLNAIANAAERITNGDLAARTGLPKGTSDLDRLAERFDQMAVSLEKRHLELEQANLEIKSQNANLEKRVAERTSELQALNQELEAFSYSVSHDLRAPLRHIGGFSSMLQKNSGEQLDPKGKRFLKTIMESANRMGALIDDLLLFSRMGRAEMRREKHALSELVDSIIEELKPEIGDRRVVWKKDALPQVIGDKALMKQVLANLLSNAVKYTGPRDPAEIHISSFEHDGEVIVTIRDNGVGFDPAYAHKLFGVFQRLHQSTEFEGTGIGLANVRRIINRHGGRVWAEAELGKGAAFHFSMPKEPTA